MAVTRAHGVGVALALIGLGFGAFTLLWCWVRQAWVFWVCGLGFRVGEFICFSFCSVSVCSVFEASWIDMEEEV